MRVALLRKLDQLDIKSGTSVQYLQSSQQRVMLAFYNGSQRKQMVWYTCCKHPNKQTNKQTSKIRLAQEFEKKVGPPKLH